MIVLTYLSVYLKKKIIHILRVIGTRKGLTNNGLHLRVIKFYGIINGIVINYNLTSTLFLNEVHLILLFSTGENKL